MKEFYLKYHLEMYTVFAAMAVLLGILGAYTVTPARKILLVIIVIGVFHEWEEKRIPGGFFEHLGVIWGWDMDSVDMRKPGQWVVWAWVFIAFIPFVFENVTGLVLAPLILGVFEMLIHTAGKWIIGIKGWYTPGIVTAWIMGIYSIYGIAALSKLREIRETDWLIGFLMFAVTMICLQNLVQNAAGSSVPQMINHMRARFSK